MQNAELIERIKNKSITADAAGRAYFSQNASDAETHAFFDAYLDESRHEELAAAIHAGFISKEYSHGDYLTARVGALELDARYFNLLLETAVSADFSEEKLAPLFAACFAARPGTVLSAWRKPAEAYLLNAAYRDYERVLNLLTAYDPFYEAYGVLMQADRKRTEEILIHRLLYGKNVRKSAIRKLLLRYRIDISQFFEGFAAQPPPMREAVVRLALLYKNDAKASVFLKNAAAFEPLSTIRRLIIGSYVSKAGTGAVWTIGDFEKMMVGGNTFSAPEFQKKLDTDPVFSAIASDLFFSVYVSNGLNNIVIVHNGVVCDLENVPVTLPDSSVVGVLHPLELPERFSYLRRLSMVQPFPQVCRPIFVPTQYELTSNVVSRLGGTVISAGAFKKNLKKAGGKLLYGSLDNAFDRVSVFMGDAACVLEFSPVDFSDPKQTVILGNARFYFAGDFISVHGKYYIEGVPPARTRDISPRMFSEFLYTLYRVGNVKLV